MYRIDPVLRHYKWGSHTVLQQKFHIDSPDNLAELWFSGHSTFSSAIHIPNNRSNQKNCTQLLSAAISQHPTEFLGEQASEYWGPVLPYLFKIIYAQTPLSLQIHPIGYEARAGFHRQNRQRIPLDNPSRSFKDPIAKDEMLLALGPFKASVGFMQIEDQIRALGCINHEYAQRMADILLAGHAVSSDMPDSASQWTENQKRIFEAFRFICLQRKSSKGMQNSGSSESPENLENPENSESSENQTSKNFVDVLRNALKVAQRRGLKNIVFNALEHALCAAQTFPDDPSVLALAMMNAISMQAGGCVFIAAGEPHVYLNGLGAEIMTNSDNVLRLGMTVKPTDVTSALHSVNCAPSSPLNPIENSIEVTADDFCTIYRPQLQEFQLAYGTAYETASATARIVVCIEGEVLCTQKQNPQQTETVLLHTGEAVFIAADDGRVSVKARPGLGKFVIASTAQLHNLHTL